MNVKYSTCGMIPTEEDRSTPRRTCLIIFGPKGNPDFPPGFETRTP